MALKYSVWADLLGRWQRPPIISIRPEVGDVYMRKPEVGPIEYAQVIGAYEEAAGILHIRFRLVYGYQDKTAEMGERTLAVALFSKRFTRRLEAAVAE